MNRSGMTVVAVVLSVALAGPALAADQKEMERTTPLRPPAGTDPTRKADPKEMERMKTFTPGTGTLYTRKPYKLAVEYMKFFQGENIKDNIDSAGQSYLAPIEGVKVGPASVLVYVKNSGTGNSPTKTVKLQVDTWTYVNNKFWQKTGTDTYTKNLAPVAPKTHAPLVWDLNIKAPGSYSFKAWLVE